MRMNTDREWLRRQAELEDDSFVSVGGLVCAIEEMEQHAKEGERTRPACARLFELTRRKEHLTIEQLAERVGVDFEELCRLESQDDYKPKPRTVCRLSSFLGVPEHKLKELLGLVRPRDPGFQSAAIRFAACSKPLEALTAESVAHATRLRARAARQRARASGRTASLTS